jgi:putative endonuclease
MFYVYALYSNVANRMYIGLTSNIERRLLEHNSGLTKSTKSYKPWALFYSEKCNTRIEAREREKYLKSGCGREILKEILIKTGNH